jgi:predicted nucleic acid-binding protein
VRRTPPALRQQLGAGPVPIAAIASASRDPNDDCLIATALHANTDVLISGDRDLTDLVDPPVRTLAPRGLLDELTPPEHA